ncbi:MAG: SlyX family protein [Bdellovibrionaceae bacterium]|nr:SlyX family protein [Pseudobdellovibrionaceae bacterium]
MTDTRLIEIETKVLQQDLLLEELNDVIYRQQLQIDQLEMTLNQMAKRLRESDAVQMPVGPGNERPPHY